MYSYRSTANFNTVEYKVIMLASNLIIKQVVNQDQNVLQHVFVTSAIRPLQNASMSCDIGAVNGWCELLHRPCAKNSLSSSTLVNNGNSVTQRKCGAVGGVYNPVHASAWRW